MWPLWQCHRIRSILSGSHVSSPNPHTEQHQEPICRFAQLTVLTNRPTDKPIDHDSRNICTSRKGSHIRLHPTMLTINNKDIWGRTGGIAAVIWILCSDVTASGVSVDMQLVFLCYGISIRLSVCPSVTFMGRTQTTKGMNKMISVVYYSPMSLVYCIKI